MKCDVDIYKAFAAFRLSDGTTMFAGFGERMMLLMFQTFYVPAMYGIGGAVLVCHWIHDGHCG